MINRGDLNHGAIQSLSARPLGPGQYRSTFVVSWETLKPLEPNCHYLSDNEIPEELHLKDGVHPKWQLSESIRRGRVQPLKANKKYEKTVINLGRKNHYLAGKFPKPMDIKEKGETYLLEWEPDDVEAQ